MLESSYNVMATPSAPSLVRAWLDEVAALQLLGQAGFDARLLAIELVSNSCRHAGLATGDPITVRLELAERRLRFEVQDNGIGFDAPVDMPIPTAKGGRGLILVAALATRWGVQRTDPMTTWFEIDFPGPRILVVSGAAEGK
jgi:serine/threonine-protein kinase RsbW